MKLSLSEQLPTPGILQLGNACAATNVEKNYSSVLGFAWFFSEDGKFPLRWVRSVPCVSGWVKETC
jgi:hypothetical protein